MNQSSSPTFHTGRTRWYMRATNVTVHSSSSTLVTPRYSRDRYAARSEMGISVHTGNASVVLLGIVELVDRVVLAGSVESDMVAGRQAAARLGLGQDWGAGFVP